MLAVVTATRNGKLVMRLVMVMVKTAITAVAVAVALTVIVVAVVAWRRIRKLTTGTPGSHGGSTRASSCLCGVDLL